MRGFFTFFTACLVSAFNLSVHAQHIFTAKLVPYQQNFDKLGTGNAIFANSTNATTISGIIAGYNYAGRFASLPSPVVANDGSTTASAAYNFGAASDLDRSLGCIAGGINGKPLDTVAGRNLGPIAHSYYCQDERPFFGLAYYRLQQADKDGTTTFSPVVAVRVAAPFSATAINVIPNPGTGHFTLQTAFDTPPTCKEQ
jgi:hypothetical protein